MKRSTVPTAALSITEEKVKVKVQGPDNTPQVKELIGMQGRFGADFDLSRPGRCGAIARSQLIDGKGGPASFWHTVK